MESTVHHNPEECQCPLASLHCPRQTAIRNQWFEAIKQSRADVLEYYIDAVVHGLNEAHEAYDFLSVRDEDSRTPLLVATFWRSKDMLAMLLAFLTDHCRGRVKQVLDMQDTRNGRTAVVEACKMGDLEMTKALREAGASMRISDFDGKDAKTYAAARGPKELIEYLEESLDKDLAPEAAVQQEEHHVEQEDGSKEKLRTQNAEVDHVVDLWETDDESEEDDNLDNNEASNQGGAVQGSTEDLGDLQAKPSRDELIVRYNVLMEQAAFKAMDEQFVAKLAKRCRRHQYEQDQTIISQEEPVSSLWMVQEGEISLIGGDGDFDTVLEDNESFGVMSMLAEENQQFQVKANRDTTMLELPRVSFAEVLERSPTDALGTLVAALSSAKHKDSKEHSHRSRKMERRIRKFFGIPRPKHEVDEIDKRQRHIQEVPLLINERDLHGVSLSENCWRSCDVGFESDLLRIPDGDQSGLSQYLTACKKWKLQPQYRAVLQLRHAKCDMQGAGMTTKDAMALGAALCANKTIKTLDVSHNALYDGGCVSLTKDDSGIIDAVVHNAGVNELRMSCTHIGRRAACALGHALLEHTGLTVLDLSHNMLGDKGAEAIANGVRDSYAQCLTELDLSNNRIGNQGGISIGKMLEVNRGLQVLSVSWNHMFPEGCAALISGAIEHGDLQTLSMDWNRLGQLGGEALGRFLSESTSILRLDVSNCGIHETAAPSLSEGVAANTSLKVAKMQWNPLGAGVPLLLAAFQDCPAQPIFRLDNCKFDMLSLQAYTVDKNNPTGHYTFHLSNEQHRQELKTLVELGMKDRGESWRNERLDGARFSFPSSDTWDIPDTGTLDFDFVYLAPIEEEAEDMLSTVDFKSLTKQINKALSASQRIDLIKQAASRFIVDGEQALSILFSLSREVERQEALVALFSRTFGREACMSKILLSCFHRPSIEVLQDRLGPRHVFDFVNPQGIYNFDMAKRSDRRALKTLCQTKKDFVYCNFPKAHFAPHATPLAKEEVHDVQSWTTEEGEAPWDGTLTVKFEVDKKAAAKAIALARQRSRAMLSMKSRRRMSTMANLVPLLSFNRTGSEAQLEACVREDEGELFDFTAAMSRKRTEYKIVTVRYPEGTSGVVRVTGMKDKPFNSRWDGGRTTVLLTIEDEDMRLQVDILTPRGENEIASEIVEWNSPKKTTITLEDEGAEEAHEALRYQKHHAHLAAIEQKQGMQEREAQQQKKQAPLSPISMERSIDFDMATKRAKGQRFWKPWAGFERSLEEDFVVHTIRLRDSKAGIGMMMERVKANIGEASCINYQMDLTLPVKMHTIPRHFTVIVSPGDDVQVYANTQGLPCEDNHIWKGESDGQDRIILVRPTDPNYVASKYFITVITSQHPAQFELTVHVAPYPPTLRQADPKLESKVASTAAFAAMTKRKGLTPPAAVQHLTVANTRTGRMLSSLMNYTAERKRKSSHGASVPPKATLHLRPSSASFDRDEFSLGGTRPSTSPERSISSRLGDEGLDEEDEEDEEDGRPAGASRRPLVSRGLVPRPSPLSQSRRRSTLVSPSAAKARSASAQSFRSASSSESKEQ